MNEHEDRSLHERVERLEEVVEQLRRTLKQLNETLNQKGIDVSVRVQETIPAHAKPPPLEIHEPELPMATEPPPKPSRTREEWEALIGGKLLNRIGALALILGIGFFLKYAFENNWINETMRVLIGLVVGVTLLFGGARFHKKSLHIFAQGLVGAGIPILYLSVYASFNFYHLVSQTVAFVLMSVVTIIAFQQALKYNSFAVSLLGWFGGFLTPFLLSTGEVNAVGLFTYIALLDAGLLVVLFKKEFWAILEPLTLIATYITFNLWHSEYYTADNLPVAIVFLTIFWGLFYALDISRIIRPVPSFPRLRQIIPAINAVLYYQALYFVINPEYHDWMAAVTLLIGAVYFITFMWTIRRHKGNETILARHALTATALLIIATGIQYSGFTLVVCWSLEALVLVWCGTRWKLGYVWKAALGLFILSAFRLFLSQFPEYRCGCNTCDITNYSPFEDFMFIFNSRALAFTVLSASLGISVLPFRLLSENIGAVIRKILHYSWSAILFVLCTVEIYDCFSDRTVSMLWLMIALGWMVYSLPMVWSGLRAKVEPVFICGISAALLAGVVTITLGLIMFDPIENFRIALNIRSIILVILIAGTFFHTHWLKNIWKEYKWTFVIRSIFQIALVLLVFSLITGETKDFFEKSIVSLQQSAGTDVSGEVNRLENLRQLSLSGIWLLYSIFLMGFGMWRRFQGLRISAIVLFGFTILKIFIYDLRFLDQLYRIFSFLGLGLILLAVSYLYQRYKAVIFNDLPGKE